MSQNYDINDIYKSSSSFLKAADIKGYRPVVEIEDFEIGEVGAEKKPQVILKFKDKEKKLGLNKTNAERLWVLSGSKNPADWVGGKVRLFVDPSVEFQGKKVEAIRISQEFWEEPLRKQQAQTMTAAATKGAPRSQQQQPSEPDPEGWNEYQSEPADDNSVNF